MALKRREFLISGVVVLAAFGGLPALRRHFSSFEFEPIPGLEDFRRLGSGSFSTGSVAFLGLDTVDDDLVAEQTRILQDPCAALYGNDAQQVGKLPIAVFSDYNCPYCAILSRRLIRLEESGAPIRLIWYEYPLLGPRSDRSANAALAAAQQDSYVAAHHYLITKVLPPGPNGLRRMARDLKLDPERLIADAKGRVVIDKLRKAQALAGTFGVIGTPTTVVGRTVVVGAISDSDLQKLISLELSEPDFLCI